ncbi:DNA polymerase IV [Candidatus Giovannonibacteria bacterium]|nr:DNA polymerase IV [Candidatus Giovannonibacteria bacterium]
MEKAILHIDGDAFFASCEQSLNPALKGKPVVTGQERGIASSMSYEAKARGITRAMKLDEVRKICPDAIILPSDYETYSLLSKRMYDIVRRHTPAVEEYSIDECFADITGLRRAYHSSYAAIAETIKGELYTELGFTFSVGLAPTKVLAKIGSKWNKPSGLTVISQRLAPHYLKLLPAGKVWGIGPQTEEFLAKKNIFTALDYAEKDEDFIRQNLSKSFYEIWQELRGVSVYPVNSDEKETYQSIQKVRTFTPASGDSNFVFSQLSKNIENACIKARRYKLAAREVNFFLRTSGFGHLGLEIKFSRATSFPNEIISSLRPLFGGLFDTRFKYRATGVALLKLTSVLNPQPDLFGDSLKVESLKKVYESVDKVREKYGKHAVFLGSSFAAHASLQHSVRRLNIPMFVGEVG